MKYLFVSDPGADYSVCGFEECFRGENVTDLIDNLDNTRSRWAAYITEHEDYAQDPEDLALEVKELKCTKEDFKWIHGCIGDYDKDKHAKIFIEGDVVSP